MKRILSTLAALVLTASLAVAGERLDIARAVGHALDGHNGERDGVRGGSGYQPSTLNS